MRGPARSATNTRVVVVQGSGLVGDNRLAVSQADTASEETGLLFPSSTDDAQSWPVRLLPLAGLPRGVMVVHEDMARAAGITATRDDDWVLRPQPATPATSVVLEPLTDVSLDEATKRIRNSTALDGQVFHVGRRADSDASWLDLDGVPYRVRSAVDSDGAPLTGLLRITTGTEVQLFMSGSRTGVDVVILADCSGSMSWDDVAATGDVSRFRRRTGAYLSRMDALKQALEQMADARLRVGGRTTRIALVRFTTRSSCVFPRDGGMAEFGSGDDTATVAEFRAAVGLLRPEERSGTDIGQALHYGSELLYRHGTPGNDRLLVLVSDGADWQEKSVEATGEMLAATADPVSLMEDLRTSLDIRLHAVGVSDETSFWPWWDRMYRRSQGDPHVSIVPNHRLLRSLVGVGGGDPSRIGGVDVLEEYFGQLGAGVTRAVGRPKREVLDAPQPEIADVARARATPPPESDVDRRDLADTVQRLYTGCIKASRHRVGRPLYRAPRDPDAILTIGAPAVSAREFNAWIMIVDHIFRERQDSCLDEQSPTSTYEVSGIHEIVRDGRLGRIRTLRQDAAHDQVGHGNERRTEQHEREVGDVYYLYSGRYHLADDDADGWSKLQVGLLRELAQLLTDIYARLNDPSTSHPAASDPSPDDGGSGGAQRGLVSLGWS